MQHRANKWLLKALLVLLVFSMSFIFAIPKAKAEEVQHLNEVISQLPNTGISGLYKIPMGLVEYDSSVSYLSLQQIYQPQRGYLTPNQYISPANNWLINIPLNYLMLYQESELSQPVLNLYTEVIALTNLWVYYENWAYGTIATTIYLFGVNQATLPYLYNYIVDNNVYLVADNAEDRVTLDDIIENIQFVCNSAIIVFGNRPMYLYHDTRFIVLTQTIMSTQNPNNIYASQSYYFQPYNFTRHFKYEILPTIPANPITNDRLLLQYYGYTEYWEIVSHSVDTLEMSGYYEGLEEGTRDILQNPNNYGLYTTNQYNTHANAEYQRGLQIGRETPYTTGTWFTTIFTGIGDIMSIEILPHLSIGLIVSIPLVISLAWFIIRTFRGGGS